MIKQELAQDTSGATLFPQFESELYKMIVSEVEELTDPQLDFESDRWEWSKWSIRRNLSHMASGDFRWLLVRWGKEIFPEGLPLIDDLDGVAASPFDRRMDENKYWDLDVILGKIRQALELCQMVLSGETVGSLRTQEIEAAHQGEWNTFAPAHPRGVRLDSNDPSKVHLSLEATFRHRYFEYTTHLYNIQRLKRAQGLAAKVEIPFEGYWALPDWDRSEP